jgi:deoxyadenosine/deoxycytidine kinase
MVMIDVDYPTVIKRIQKRGREYEQVETDPSLVDYYKRLLKYYAKWKHDYDASPLLVINGAKYDFMSNLEDRQAVLDQIYRELLRINSLDDERFSILEKALDSLRLDDKPALPADDAKIK